MSEPVEEIRSTSGKKHNSAAAAPAAAAPPAQDRSSSYQRAMAARAPYDASSLSRELQAGAGGPALAAAAGSLPARADALGSFASAWAPGGNTAAAAAAPANLPVTGNQQQDSVTAMLGLMQNMTSMMATMMQMQQQMMQQMQNSRKNSGTNPPNGGIQPPDGAAPKPPDGTTPAPDNTMPPGEGKKMGTARGTGYYPDNSAMEGGYNDMKGKKLTTLQDFLNGKAPYVSIALDKNLYKSGAVKYGDTFRIPELEKKYGKPILFKAVDTGGAFTNKGFGRVDICTGSRKDSVDPTVNGSLTLMKMT